MNWIFEKSEQKDRESKGLEKAKRLEAKLIEKGYRWYRITSRLKILVPFDKDGNLTKQGEVMVQKQKDLLGIT